VQTTASAEELVYVDAKRLATYTSGPKTKAHMVGTEGDITAEQIQLFLKESGGELERAEADRNVVIKEGIRTVTGEHLVYTTADETYVVTGAPVTIEEKTPTECRVSDATTLTFKRAEAATTLEPNRVAPVKFRQCAAK